MNGSRSWSLEFDLGKNNLCEEIAGYVTLGSEYWTADMYGAPMVHGKGLGSLLVFLHHIRPAAHIWSMQEVMVRCPEIYELIDGF
jgi:hypothetical protein